MMLDLGQGRREGKASLSVYVTLPAQRLVWAAKQPLGNAALGALFA